MWTVIETYKGKVTVCLNFTKKVLAAKWFLEYLARNGADLSRSQQQRLCFKHDHGIIKVIENNPVE